MNDNDIPTVYGPGYKPEPQQPTPTELALIAAPLLTDARRPYDTYDDALDDAYDLWLAARAFCEEQKDKLK